MKKITKLLCLLLALSLCFTLAACNTNKGDGNGDGDGDPDTTPGEVTGTDIDDKAGQILEGDATPWPMPDVIITSLTVGFDPEFPPYGFVDDNGDYVGFDLDLAAEVCRLNGWELILQPINWDAKDLEINSGNIDCIWNGFTINGREDLYTWTIPYVDNTQVFVVRADSGIKDIAGLAGKVVMAQADSSAETALKSTANADMLASFAELQPVSDYLTAMMNLESGIVDAVAVDIGVARFQLEDKEDLFVILDEHLATEQYGIGFKLGNELYRDAVQNTLLHMANNGTFTEIAEKWGLIDSVTLGK